MFFRELMTINRYNLLWYALKFVSPEKIVEECELHNDSGEWGSDVVLSMHALAEFLISVGIGNTTGLKKILEGND